MGKFIMEKCLNVWQCVCFVIYPGLAFLTFCFKFTPNSEAQPYFAVILICFLSYSANKLKSRKYLFFNQ